MITAHVYNEQNIDVFLGPNDTLQHKFSRLQTIT